MLPSPMDLFRYSFRKFPGSVEPITQVGGYNKTKNGDFVLSPFATWRLQLLESANTKVKVNWTDLQSFEDYVDINL